MKISELCAWLESIAPLSLQESYDNSGLITGNHDREIKGILVCLDSTEAVVEEAIQQGCNLIVAHHPIVFSGIKKLTGKNYVERVLIKAIQADIAIYAAHTNLDNVFDGVNHRIADVLGLSKLSILAPKNGLLNKLSVLCPLSHTETVRTAIFQAGAGSIADYAECSFNSLGTGTFLPQEGADPFIGSVGSRQEVEEVKIDVIFESWKKPAVLAALFAAHPYEEVAYFLSPLANLHQEIGSGMIGCFNQPLTEHEFLSLLKNKLKTDCVRHTAFLGQKIEKIAICGGSGSFLLPDAIRQGAQAFVTADFKYHQFFDADGKILIADVGHYESEQFTMNLLKELILKKNATFAVRLTEVKTNPVCYY